LDPKEKYGESKEGIGLDGARGQPGRRRNKSAAPIHLLKEEDVSLTVSLFDGCQGSLFHTV
jgi:hypothetical protein